MLAIRGHGALVGRDLAMKRIRLVDLPLIVKIGFAPAFGARRADELLDGATVHQPRAIEASPMHHHQGCKEFISESRRRPGGHGQDENLLRGERRRKRSKNARICQRVHCASKN